MLSVWSCGIFWWAGLLQGNTCTCLVFSGMNLGLPWKTSYLFRVFINICSGTARFEVQMKNCIILWIFNTQTHTPACEVCTWAHRSHTRLEPFTSAERQPNLSFSDFCSGVGRLKYFLFQFGFWKVISNKRISHMPVSMNVPSEHGCSFVTLQFGCYFTNGKRRGLEEWLAGHGSSLQQSRRICHYITFSPVHRIQWPLLVEGIIAARKGTTSFKYPSY